MSTPSAQARTADSPAKAADHQPPAALQSRQHPGTARLQQMAGNRIVASLFDSTPAYDSQEQEAQRISDEFGGPTAPLGAAIKSAEERGSAAGLADVRLHDDSASHEMTDAIGARAFTLGDQIFFSLGASSDHRLLAHELTHVLQQRRSGQMRIQRAPKEGGAKQPSAADKRQFVEESVKYLREMADFYRDKIRIAQVSKTSPKVNAGETLKKWKKAIETDLTLVDEKTDAKLLTDLKTAYREMVEAIVTADSMSQSKATLRETFEKYRGDIHESGWLLGVAEPDANKLSDAIPEGERGKIKVITTTRVTEPMLDLPDAFSTVAKTAPPEGVHIVFAGSIPAKLQAGLSAVGGKLVSQLKPPPLSLNSTITLALDLSKYGGDYALFRFTFYQHSEVKNKKKSTEKQLLIERLGTVGMEGLRENDAAWKRFRSKGFKFDGQWKMSEKEAVVAATQLMPESQLAMVSGLTFKRDSASGDDPKEAGNYKVEDHTITLFDRAFQESAVRFGAPGASLATSAVYDVAHEIGHAIDRRKYRAALTGKATAETELRKKFGQYEVTDKAGKGTGEFRDIPNDVMAEFNDLISKASGKAADAVVTESGERWQKDDLKDDPAKVTDFKKAGAGTRISPYADTKWREYFAESFALYTTNPATLQRLRPKLYTYFEKNYPKT